MKETMQLTWGGGTFPTYQSSPDGSATCLGLIVIEEIWGVNDHIKNVCDRFAAEGFIVLSPELLPEGLLEKMTPEVNVKLFDPATRHEVQPMLREAMAPMSQPAFAKDTVAKLKACVDYLLTHERVNGKVGVLGFCFGGTYAFHLAAHDDRIKAAVPFYGRVPQPSDVAERISCPILNFDGALDEGVMAQVSELETAMKRNARDYTHIVYPDAGHAFFNDTNTRAYRAADAHDAWQRSLAFLRKELA